jgi:hypothetical protein
MLRQLFDGRLAAHNPRAVLVQVRNAMLASDVEAAA